MNRRLIHLLFWAAAVFLGQPLAVSPVRAVDLDKGLSIEGIGVADFTFATGDSYQSPPSPSAAADANSARDNGFHITRAYLTVKDKISDDLFGRFTYDQKDGTGKNAFVKFIYGDYTYMPDQKIRFGLGQTPWVDYEEGLYTLRWIIPVMSELQFVQVPSDLGVSLVGSFMDNLVDYHVGVYEGEGYATASNGQGLAYAGRVGVNVQGLTLSVFDWMETKRSGIGGYNPSRFIGMLTYGTPLFRVAGQYLTADDNISGLDPPAVYTPAPSPTTNPLNPSTIVSGPNTISNVFNKGTGFSFWGYTRIPGMEALRICARYDSIKPDKDVDNGANTLAALGVVYDLTNKTSVALNASNKNRKIDNAGNSVTDNLLLMKMMVGF